MRLSLRAAEITTREVDECLGRFASGDEQAEAARFLTEKIAGRLAKRMAKKKFANERVCEKMIIRILGDRTG